MKVSKAFGKHLPWAGLFLLLGVFFWKAFLPDHTFFARDTLRMHGPIRQYAAERLSSGELPLWWSYEALGTPFLAQAVTSVLHPLSLLSLPLSVPNALRFVTLSCFFLGALGVYCLARRLSLSPAAAVFAALGFSFSGYTVSLSDNWFYLAGANTVPWFLCAVDGVCRRGMAGLPFAAFVLGSALLLGDFEAAYVMTGVGFLWALVHAPVGQRAARVGILSLGVMGAALLSSVQLGASWELLGHTARKEGLVLDETLRWSLHPFRVFEWMFGRVLPEQGGRFEYSRLLMGEPLAGVWANCVYVGVLFLALALCAVFFSHRLDASRRRHVVFLAALLGVALWMALGKYGGLYALALKVLPLWSAFRFPEKLLPFAVLPTSLLAAVAVDEAGRLPLLRWLLGTLGVGLLAAACLWAFPHALAEAMQAVDAVKGPFTVELRQGAALDMLSTALHSSWQATLAVALGAAAYFLLSQRWPAGARWALAVVAVVELGASTHPSFEVTGHPLSDFEPAFVEPLSQVARNGRYRFVTLTGPRPLLQAPRPGLTPTESLSYLEKQSLSPDFNVPWKLDNLNPYLPGALENLAELRRKSGNWARVGALFSTRYLVLLQSDWAKSPKPPQSRVMAELPELNLALVDSGEGLPRSYLACAEAFEDRPTALRRMVDARFPGGRHVVVVRGDDPEGLLPRCAGAPGPQGTLEVVDYQQEQVTLRARADSPAVAVLNDAFYAGWEATVNGVPTPVVQVNLAVRGVPLPQGTHEVVFRYRPRWLWPSLFMSSLAGLGLLGLALYFALRAQRIPSSDQPS